MSSFGSLFKKVNGKKVLKEYAQSHVLFHALLLTVVEGTSKKSLEIVRESVSNKVVGRLRRQYKTFISDFKKNDSDRSMLPREHSNRVWVCWLQGMEDAPLIVKKMLPVVKRQSRGQRDCASNKRELSRMGNIFGLYSKL